MSAGDVEVRLMAADEAYRNYDFETALNHYKSVLDVATGQSSSHRTEKLRNDILLKIVDVLDSSGNWVDALMYIDTITKTARKHMNRRLEMEANLRAAKILTNRSVWKEAGKRYLDTLELGKKHGVNTIIAKCHYGLAYVAWRLGDMDAARVGTEKSLKMAVDCNDGNIRGQALNLLATIADNVGDTDLAIKRFGEAIEVCEAAGDFKEMARSFNNLGEVYKGTGDYLKASEQYKKCVDSSKRSNDRHTEAYGLTNAAECLTRLGNIGEAEERVKQAEEILATMDDKYAIAYTHYVRALILHKTNNQNGARQEFETALNILKELNAPYDISIVSLDYGRALKDFGQKDEAKKVYMKALEGFRKLNATGYLEKTAEAMRELDADM
ncbi:MAG: tetratricopeptide repeat protein [Thermoplasmata archaeon]|nr:tetratricopeptide repeat protein [Thermoplasmata archaeon]